VSKYQYLIYLSVLFAAHTAEAMNLDDAISASLSHESQLELSRIGVNQSTAILGQATQRDGLRVNLVGQLDYEKIETQPT
jgi:hypothetical protein